MCYNWMKTIKSFRNVFHVDLGPKQSFKTRFLSISTAVTYIKIKIKRKPTENGRGKTSPIGKETIIRATYLNVV